MREQTNRERLFEEYGDDDHKKKQPTPAPFVPSEYSMYPTIPHQSTGGTPPPPDVADWLSDFNSWILRVGRVPVPIRPGKNQSVLIVDFPTPYPDPLFVTWQAERDACDTCKANQAAGMVKQGTLFPGGVSAPPQHQRCKCVLLPVLDDTIITKTDDLERSTYIIAKEPDQ